MANASDLLSTMPMDEFVSYIPRVLKESTATPDALFTFVVGAGFSVPVVPLTTHILSRELPAWLNKAPFELEQQRLSGEPIGDYFQAVIEQYLPDPGQRRAFFRHVISKAQKSVNLSHLCLASILQAQFSKSWGFTQPFCRTVFTTNFDPLLQHALQLTNQLYFMSDRPDVLPVLSDDDHPAIHLVYTHGSIHQHFLAATKSEITTASSRENISKLRDYFEEHGVLVVGYSGWKDACMQALQECRHYRHGLYWLGIQPEWVAAQRLDPSVRQLLSKPNAWYVPVPQGADHAMQQLHLALGLGATPISLYDPLPSLIQQLDKLTTETPNTPHATYEFSTLIEEIIRRTTAELVAAKTFLDTPDQISHQVEKVKELRKSGEALRAMLADNRAEAIEKWSELLRYSTLDIRQRVNAHLERGILYFAVKSYAEAVEDFSKVLESWDSSDQVVSKALEYRARAHLAAGEFEKARSDATELISHADRVEQRSKSLYREKLRAAKGSSDPQPFAVAALALIGISSTAATQRATALSIRAEAYDKTRDFKAALDDYSALLAQADLPDSSKSTALENRAALYLRNQEAEKALSDATTLLGLRSITVIQRAKGHFASGIAYAALGRKDEAITSYSQAVEFQDAIDTVCRAYVNRGNLHAEKGNLNSARADWSRVIDMRWAPALPKAKALVNRAKNCPSNEAEAIADCSTAINMKDAPLEDHYRALLVRAVLTLGEPQAIADCDSILAGTDADSGSRRDALYVRALCYEKQGQLAKALADFTQLHQATDLEESLKLQIPEKIIKLTFAEAARSEDGSER